MLGAGACILLALFPAGAPVRHARRPAHHDQIDALVSPPVQLAAASTIRSCR